MLSGKAPQASEARSNRQIVSTLASVGLTEIIINEMRNPAARGNTAWRHEAPRIIRFGDAQDMRDTGGFYWFVFFPGKENEQA